jgi:two-component system, OmpR family, sensor histidine kinase BaeS
MRPVTRVAVLAAAVLAAVVIATPLLRPTTDDLLVLTGLFAVPALMAAGAALVLMQRVRSIAGALRAMVVVALGGTALVVAGAASVMVVDGHDARVVLLALGLGSAVGLVTAGWIGEGLAADLGRLAVTARRIGRGELDARTGIDRGGEVGELVAAVDDMAARLDGAERARRRDEAARRDLLAALGHDLRTPLASLRAAVEALQDGVARDPERYVDAMAADIDVLARLVDDLFTLARIERGELRLQPEPVDLAELADTTVATLEAFAQRRNLALTLSVDGDTTAVVDPHAIGRVLRNLLDNALRHAPDRTTVDVTVVGDGDHVALAVIDEGPGFDPSFRARATAVSTRFDEARTRSGGGAGLGLPIARGLVEAHGGRLLVHPQPGGRVTVRLPR